MDAAHPHVTPMLRTADICRRFRVSQRTLTRWLATGRFPQPVRVTGRKLLWREETVEAFIARHERAAVNV